MLLLKVLIKLVLLLLVLLAVLAVVSHQKLPQVDRTARPVQRPAELQGPLAAHLLPQIAAHPGLSGIHPLASGRDAFLARLALAEAAQHTLDVQYYIWHDDISGRLLLQSLYRAAERGVHVRLLLDDNNTAGMDALLAAFNAHPNTELRLFNPFMQRRHRLLGYLSDFFRLNRRMHNKSFTADGLITIVGGRNVGDEYFDAGSGVMFADLDVVAAGAVAQAVEADFQRYWTSESVYPAEHIITTPASAFNTQPAQDEGTQAYLAALRQSPLAAHLRAGELPAESVQWAPTRLVSDDPAKGLGRAAPENTVLHHIGPVMLGAEKELLIVSPYFVPTQQGTELFGRVAQSGRDVRILTNSLAATDVAPVHAGYAKYRKALLRSGVHLYELKPDVTVHTRDHGGITGSSGASLHAKTFVVDGRQLFIGSFNMDPRSARLNTEMGFLIDSPALTAHMVANLKNRQAEHTYTVTLDEKDRLHWQTQHQGQTLQFKDEPQSTALQRAIVWLCARLPIEWLL